MPDRQEIDVYGLDALVTDPKSPDTGSGAAIRVNNLSKIYKLYPNPRARLMETFHPLRRKYHWDFYALKDINFEVKKGEVLGIIGRNGSGKSTLLKIISGLLQPTVGSVQVNGNISALLELGSGFNPEVTGIENVYFYGSIMGFSRNEIRAVLDEVLGFADIGDFVNQPVKTYSSGMILRLAFAVQTCLEPDVLVVDEILSVGDIFFQQKCHGRMEELIARNTAVVIVSHNMQAIEKYSTKVMLLDNGGCLFLGQPNEAVQRYYALREVIPPEPEIKSVTCTDNIRPSIGASEAVLDSIPDWPEDDAFLNLSQAVIIGDVKMARCTGVAICNQEGKPCNVFQIGEVAYFYYEFEVLQDIEVPLGGLNITNRMNIVVHAKNSLQSGVEAPSVVRRGSRVRFRQTMELNIAPGEYTFAVSLATMGAEDYSRLHKVDYDYLHSRIRSILRVRQAGQILVKRGLALPFHGYVDLKGDITLSILKRMGDTKSEYKRVKNARRESILLPKNAFYLVSYPRSGNTWLLYSLSMLFKAIRSVARAEFELYPYLYGRVVSDGFYLKSENEIDMSRPLIIKSHETQDIYERLYPKAKCIYIYRDGRDALLSFYFFKKAFSVKEQTILERIGKMQDLASRTSRRVDFDADEFAVFLEKHTPKWANHVKEWLKVDSILAVSYEDLSRCFEGMLREITAYLGIVPSVSISDVKKEYVDGYRSSFSGDSRHFFRKGIVGDWKNYFTEAHVRIFLESGGDLNVKLGYE